MKTITLDLLKKNRVYFKCLTTNGYEVKLKITPKSENLELGKHELLVNDVSVRTKYGTDVIYELESVTEDAGIVALSHRFNTDLVKRCKDLGGRWDGDEKVWVFSKIVEDKVEELEEIYNSEEVNIEIKATGCVSRGHGKVEFCGYPVASASGRDSGASLCDGISLIEGRVSSGGSVKNWATVVYGGSILRMSIPKKVLGFNYPDVEIKFNGEECVLDDDWIMKVI